MVAPAQGASTQEVNQEGQSQPGVTQEEPVSKQEKEKKEEEEEEGEERSSSRFFNIIYKT